MDARKVTLLFGELRPGDDPDDEEVRHRLVRERVLSDFPTLAEGSAASGLIVLVHQLLADQIAEEDPPEVWRTARRLLDSGMTSKFVMSNLLLAANASFADALQRAEPIDHERYVLELERLPLPPVREVFDAVRAMVRDRRGVPSDELVATVVAQLSDGNGASGNVEHWVELALDRLLDHETSLMMIPPDLVVHVPTLLDGNVLTHCLTDSERAGGWIEAGADLAVLGHFADALHLAEGSEIELRTLLHGEDVLVGPEGWLEQFEPGTLLGFEVEGDTLSLRSVPEPGAPEPQLVDAARAAYDREVDEPTPDLSAKLDLPDGTTLEILGYLASDTSVLDPYVVSECSQPQRLQVAINMLHPYLHRITGTDGLLHHFRHCIYDAVPEWQARIKAATLDPDTVKLLKDRLLRLPMEIEMHAQL